MLLAVTNIGDEVEKVSLQCVGEKSAEQPLTITIRPSATSITAGCSVRNLPDLQSYMQELKRTNNPAVQGIEIIGDKQPGSLTAFALAPHNRNGSTLFSAIPFLDPGLVRSANTVFVGVPIGPQATLPEGVYIPHLTFTNFAATSAHLTISLANTPESRLSEPDSDYNSASMQPVRELTIAPRRSVEFVLNGAESNSGLLHSLLINSDRKPGEVASKLVSRSDGNLYQVELLGKDEKDPNNGGMHPWSIEGDTESHLLLFNHSASPRVMDVAIANGEIIWDKKYTVGISETIEISFNQLIQDKVKDDHGHILSPNRHRGTVNWMVPESGEAKGRLMVTSRSLMMARSFSCESLTVLCGFGVAVINADIPIGNFIDYVTAEPSFCSTPSSNPMCSGAPLYSGSATYNSSVSPSSVLRFNSPSDQYSSSPNLYGIAIGTGSFHMTAQAGGCQSSGGGSPPPSAVAIPIGFTIVQGPSLPNGTLQWTYSWSSSSGNLADLSQCKAGESVFYPGKGATYTWPLPMVTNQPTPNPSVLLGPAAAGAFADKNGPPDSYQKPYMNASFTATQRIQWECSNYQNGAFFNFVPDISIIRSVQLNGSLWQYTITKSGDTATVNLP